MTRRARRTHAPALKAKVAFAAIKGEKALAELAERCVASGPFAGSRVLRDLLRGESIEIGRELVATMMRLMGIETLYRRPNTSKPAEGHKIYP